MVIAMRIDIPLCNFRNCKYQFDGNCTNQLPYGYERCEFNRMRDRLQIDPSGTDKIDELEEAIGYARPERHGMWINGEECSVCGAEFRDDETDYFCYCPFCGALMNEKDGENDE